MHTRGQRTLYTRLYRSVAKAQHSFFLVCSLARVIRRNATPMRFLAVITAVVVVLVVVNLASHHAHATATTANFFKMPAPWGWRCEDGRCVKHAAAGGSDLVPLNQCKLTCGGVGVLWPLPASASVGRRVSLFLPHNAALRPTCPAQVCPLLQEAFVLFRDALQRYHPDYTSGEAPWAGPWDAATEAHALVVAVTVEGAQAHLTLDTDESYSLSVNTSADGAVTTATIVAPTFFGARHALETLAQLVDYHETRDALMVVQTAAVTDAPAFAYRGLLVDTSRNFVTVAALRRTVDAMAASKLNTLHWHITDSHSFPLVLHSLPNMAYYGAYSARQVYTPAQVRDLVQYARVRGVRVLPELDAPAHVGNGWQWAEKEGLGRLAVCVNQEPWQQYCEEPPCGQLNPSLNATYSLLGQLYTHLLQLFPAHHYFHYGASQVSINCWNLTEEVTEYLKETGRGQGGEDFHDLWGEFQRRARELVEAASGDVTLGVVRSSSLTEAERRKRHLDPEYYIIQITTPDAVEEARRLTQEGYSVILSDPKTWDLSSGHGDAYGSGPVPKNAYKGWQAVYGTHLQKGAGPGKVLGGEAVLWSRQVDGGNLDATVWPRAAALAERLWSNPSTSWREAETRFIHHRQRLVQRGVQAERIQPQWCHQNEELCYL
uniref:Beta-hexosaminidase n=1 Tax=Scylla olivacea TaxID=85551 RepID=A0A0P4VQB6_SCYOL